MLSWSRVSIGIKRLRGGSARTQVICFTVALLHGIRLFAIWFCRPVDAARFWYALGIPIRDYFSRRDDKRSTEGRTSQSLRSAVTRS